VLFTTLDFSLETTTRLAPLFEELFSFFITTFISQLFVLRIEPHLLEFLLSGLSSRVVVLVVRSAFKLVNSIELNLFTRGVKGFER